MTTMYKRPYHAGYKPPVRNSGGLGPGDDAPCFIGRITAALPALVPTLVNKLLAGALIPYSKQFGILSEIFDNTTLHGKLLSAAIGIPIQHIEKTTRLLLDLNKTAGPFAGLFAYRFIKRSNATLAFTRFEYTCVLELDGAFSDATYAFYTAAWKTLEDNGIPFTFHVGKGQRTRLRTNKKYVWRRRGRLDSRPQPAARHRYPQGLYQRHASEMGAGQVTMKVIGISLLLPILATAQSPDSLIRQLTAIHTATTKSSFPISERAMNIYLSNRIGYYLSDPNDLTLYKNSVLTDATTGQVAVNHSLYQPKDADQRIRNFATIGVKAYAKDPSYTRLGFLFKQTWITDGRIRYKDAGQKSTMDALTGGILQTLTNEIRDKIRRLRNHRYHRPAAIQLRPPRRIQLRLRAAAIRNARQTRRLFPHYPRLDQPRSLSPPDHRKHKSRTHTGITVYYQARLPRPPRPQPYPALGKHPLRTLLSHWDRQPAPRQFPRRVPAGHHLFQKLLARRLQQLPDPDNNSRHRLVPAHFHVGFSLHAEQDFGPYHALNAGIGVPIVLINKRAEPACNFEFLVRFSDLANTLPPGRGLPGKTSIGLTAGIPFSKIAF
ncbi:hypothetical protein ACQ86N_25090 [Puia sp. P3]|uniref:hypothetical protein n=1 Tax=Puia sp. P3 TaxID=3423952 RepID=UPI003D66D42A